MTFCQLNISKGNRDKTKWELSRFCCSMSVVGGASKLFKHFLKFNKPLKIVS
jgi:hypothetical protein